MGLHDAACSSKNGTVVGLRVAAGRVGCGRRQGRRRRIGGRRLLPFACVTAGLVPIIG